MGGKRWTTFRDPNLTAYPWGCYGLSDKANDGTLVSVICATYVMSAEERRTYLERHGIQRSYNPNRNGSTCPGQFPWPKNCAGKGTIFMMVPSTVQTKLVFSLIGFVYRTSRDR